MRHMLDKDSECLTEGYRVCVSSGEWYLIFLDEGLLLAESDHPALI